MAQKYGGQFSPDAKNTAPNGRSRANLMEGKSVDRATARPNFLFLAALPLLLTAFGQNAVGMAIDLAAFAVLAFGVFMLREGLKAEAAYHERSVAKPPRLPRKILAAILMGIGLALAASDPGSFNPTSLIYGVIGAVLHLMAFGIDPLSSKGTEGISDIETDRVARAVDKAEDLLDAMGDAIKRTRNRDLQARVEAFQATARRMFRTVENDPRDLRAARKYLGVYLKGARDATVKFADIYARSENAEARADYEALLDDLETNFTARTEQLLVEDKTDLDVKIEVLRDRLQREGLRPD